MQRDAFPFVGLSEETKQAFWPGGSELRSKVFRTRRGHFLASLWKDSSHCRKTRCSCVAQNIRTLLLVKSLWQ
jgi:hypothetical protein